MPILRTYECPSCEGKFKFLHHPSDEPAPRFCPLCGFDTNGEAPQVLAMPALKTSASIAVDNVHAAMQEGAEYRAQVAQEQFNFDAQDAKTLKLDDFRTDARVGENSAAPVVNDVTRFMDSNPGVGGFSPQGASYSGAVQTGPFPNAGARAMESVRRLHSSRGGVVTDNPALETQAPGYRKRV